MKQLVNMRRIRLVIVFAVFLFALVAVYFGFFKNSGFIKGDIKISFFEIPTGVKINTPVYIGWVISSPRRKNIEDTSIVYGMNSVVNPRQPGDYPKSSASLKGVIPNKFSIPVQFSELGQHYFRAKVVIEDINYWSSEAVINVVK